MRIVRAITCFMLAFSLSALAFGEDWRFDGVGRVVALSDVHGAFDPMIRTLENAGVIDDERQWTAADTQLVIVGDLLDRGPDSRKAMDFLMRLEQEAEAGGGRVHVLMGNHEVMNLVGDMRYVSKAEYAAFAADETPAERDRWFRSYADRSKSEEDQPTLRKKFDDRFPAGFFAHRRAFAADGAYGRWLLSKPVLVVVNGTAFVHGGLSPMTGELGLAGVNGRLRKELTAYVRYMRVLEEAGVLLPTDNFYEHADIVEAFVPGLSTSAETMEALQAIPKLGRSELHAIDGPLWYRGNAYCSRLIEEDRLTATLAKLGATRVVIGHTPTPNRQMLERWGGRVIEVDTGMLNAYYGGSGHALVIVDDVVGVVSEDSAELQRVGGYPRQVGARRAGFMTTENIEALLRSGEIRTIREDETKRRIVTLSDGANTIDALFTERERRGLYADVAAYRLDRLLELDFVPAAEIREVDGDEGSLMFLSHNSIDETARSASGRGGSASCPLDIQWAAMYVFDSLIYNEGRSLARMLYNQATWQLLLIGHEQAFSTQKGRPRHLRELTMEIGGAWIRALESLNEDLLEERLGDVLDRKRRAALLRRRDELLREVAAANPAR